MAFETFLAELTKRISQPTEDMPTVRCWKRARLQSLAVAIRAHLIETGKSTTKEISGTKFIELLREAGLAHLVTTEPTPGGSNADLLVLELGEPTGAEATPYEMLQAYEPKGVICYFSALAYHSLTSQPATHHHIAILTRPTKHAVQAQEPPATAEVTLERKESDPLGTASFIYEAVPYYLNRREARLVPGIQKRWEGPRTLLRVTTREQTLLDTLSRPLICGGETVVFEAWERAAAELDHERLSEYLHQIGNPALGRRVGAMLEQVEIRPAERLQSALNAARSSIDREHPIPLLPGATYANVNTHWGVLGL
jgi:predicted transcriptional regulator of viral defense system